MNLLDRYVIRAMLGGVFVVMAVLLTLSALFLFANQQDDIGVGTFTRRSTPSGSCCSTCRNRSTSSCPSAC